MAKPKLLETDLYAPIKAFLVNQGYEVKAEIGAADVVAIRNDEPPVIVEMKTGFSLALFHQATERQTITDNVYIAVPRGTGRAFQASLLNNKRMCRRLGLGLLSVRMKDGFVEAHLDPAPYKPRQSKVKAARLLREFERRVGDPNIGGTTRKTVMTAYRQDALRCLDILSNNGPTKASHVAQLSNVDRARTIMSSDHYGWFVRIATGIYDLSPKGIAAKDEYQEQLFALTNERGDL